MHLQESGEMYLETVYILTKKSDSVRSIDIANELGYKTVFWSFAYADWDNVRQPSPARQSNANSKTTR